DASGLFSFKGLSGEGPYIFQISHVGYISQTLSKDYGHSTKEESLYILLKDKDDLEEVVITYGSQLKSHVTGSLAQVNVSSLQDLPVNQFAQQLEGKVAGMQVAQSSGQPGRGVDFRIRGAASFASGHSPLFVIDGMPITGSINNISPDEIESITVLKDASASSLYGSRAANGVILITTKHAKKGAPTISVNGYYGVQKIPQKGVPKMMNAREFAEFENEYYQDKVTYENYTGKLDTTYVNPERYGKGTDWFAALTRSAPIQSYDVSYSAASDHSATMLIGSYTNQQGVVINSGTQLFSLRLNQDFSFFNNKLKTGINFAPSYRLDHNNRLTTEGVGGLVEKASEASPLIAPISPNGTIPLYVNSPGMVANLNPYAQFMDTKDNYATTRLLGNTYLNYEIIKGLTLKTNVGLDMGYETRDNFIPSFITANNVATATSSYVSNYSWTAEAYLNYKKTLFEDHHFEALAGYSGQKFSQVSNSVSGSGFPDNSVPYLSAATSITAGSSNTTQYSLVSMIGRLNYDYKNKYLLSAAFRNDGSSRFGSDRKYGNFPSVSLGWVLSEEDFMHALHPVSFLKVRASYGLTGNNNIGNYTYIPNTGSSNYVLGGALTPGTTITTLGNNDLAWERNKQFDIGLDLSLFNNRISFTYDYYHRITDGLIQSRPIPQASGFTTITSNVGALSFWGHEFAVNSTNLKGKLKWNTAFNISFDRNIIKSLVSPGFLRRNNTITSDYYRNQVGHHLGEFYGFVFKGLYKDQKDLDTSAQYGTASAVGTIKMQNLNSDHVIDDNDRTFIGNPNPNFLFGMTNTFQYTNFDLSFTISGSQGGKILTAAKWAYLSNMDGARGMLEAIKDRWRSPQDPGSGVYPRTLTGTTAIGRSVNSQWVEDGSYLTIKNITLGYTLPIKAFHSGFQKIRVYASVQQVYNFTKFTGQSPEVSLNALDGTGLGIDENAYPIPRTFAFGITTNF
ncbi:MAG TPA: TonB-dependent receptor, partial [Puia sp.]|nr:TonB-dependent receptor [Puia sp.]